MKNIKIPLIIGLIIVATVVIILAVRPSRDQGLILFYGDTCPHCKIVEQYISDHNIRAKLKFQELEVYENKDNAASLGQYARRCGLDLNKIGVPFFWNGQTCLVGEPDIINYFKQL
jgi:glutaredoxin